ncbi:unnamed protein product [Calypogeia fissa]
MSERFEHHVIGLPRVWGASAQVTFDAFIRLKLWRHSAQKTDFCTSTPANERVCEQSRGAVSSKANGIEAKREETEG